MKKIFTIAIAAIVVLASCTKNQIIETVDQNAIGFEMFSHKTTKATLTDLDVVKATASFPIVAYLNTVSDGSAVDFFNTTLNWNGTKWDTNPTRYWPNSTVVSPATQTLSFFAYYPATGITYKKNSYPTNKPILDYTVEDAAENQVDILGGFVLAATNEGGNHDAITLQMNHLLSQVNFYLKGEKENLKYKVTALTIGGALGNVGSYLYNEATPWTVTPGTKVYTYSGSFAASYDNTGAALQGLADDKAFMLLPQALTGSSITVTYSVTDANDIELLPSAPRSVALTGSWEPAKNYVYTITLKDNLNPIEYNVSVGTWTEVPGTVEIN